MPILGYYQKSELWGRNTGALVNPNSPSSRGGKRQIVGM